MRLSIFGPAKILTAVCLIAINILAGPAAPSQEPTGVSADAARGIQLYEQGEIPEAIASLTNSVSMHPKDADAWYYLGLALNRNGYDWVDKGHSWRSREAFDRAVMLRPEFADGHVELANMLMLEGKNAAAAAEAASGLERGSQCAKAHYVLGTTRLRAGKFDEALPEAEAALRLDSGFGPAHLLKAQCLTAAGRYEDAASSVESFLSLSPDDPDADAWREDLQTLKKLGAAPVSGGALPTEPYSFRDVSTRAKFLAKPEPGYTEAARRAAVSGTVVLRAVLSSDGVVRDVIILRGLSHGLTKNALASAHNSKFTPATLNGQPVSQYVMLEFMFTVY